VSTLIECPGLPVESGYIYWVDNKARTISRIRRDLTQRQVIIEKGIVGCEGIAVDWIAGKRSTHVHMNLAAQNMRWLFGERVQGTVMLQLMHKDY